MARRARPPTEARDDQRFDSNVQGESKGPGAGGLGNDWTPIGHLAVSHDKNISRSDLAECSIGGVQRLIDFRPAEVRVELVREAPRSGDVGLIAW